jgi:hypothetical protein
MTNPRRALVVMHAFGQPYVTETHVTQRKLALPQPQTWYFPKGSSCISGRKLRSMYGSCFVKQHDLRHPSHGKIR